MKCWFYSHTVTATHQHLLDRSIWYRTVLCLYAYKHTGYGKMILWYQFYFHLLMILFGFASIRFIFGFSINSTIAFNLTKCEWQLSSNTYNVCFQSKLKPPMSVYWHTHTHITTKPRKFISEKDIRWLNSQVNW